MSAEPAAVPLPNPVCPCCGQPNQCAVAASGTFATDCWCAGVKIDAAALARVPESERGRGCLCPACAGARA